MQRGLLGLVGLGDQSGQDVDEVVRRSAVAGVLDLGDILELVDHGFDQRALAEHQFVSPQQDFLSPVFAAASH